MSELLEASTIEGLVAIARRNADPTFVASVVGLYLEHTPGLISGLKDALAKCDKRTAASLAHRIKGSSVSIGARAVAQHCVHLEALCRQDVVDNAAAATVVAQLQTAYATTADELKRVSLLS